MTTVATTGLKAALDRRGLTLRLTNQGHSPVARQ